MLRHPSRISREALETFAELVQALAFSSEDSPEHFEEKALGADFIGQVCNAAITAGLGPYVPACDDCGAAKDEDHAPACPVGP